MTVFLYALGIVLAFIAGAMVGSWLCFRSFYRLWEQGIDANAVIGESVTRISAWLRR